MTEKRGVYGARVLSSLGFCERAKKKPRKRIEIKGKYMQVRQRSTKKGKKRTIMGKWELQKKTTRKKK